MSRFLTAAESRAFEETDVENLIPAGDYKVKITSIEPAQDNPERKCFKFKVMSGDYARRQLRAWPSTAPDLIWTLKRLIGEVVADPSQLQLEDLEGHVFAAEVSVEVRKDNGEKTNRVLRLSPWGGDADSVPWDEEDEDS